MLKHSKFTSIRTLLVAATLASQAFAFGSATAAEVAPTIYISNTGMSLYHDDQVIVSGCYITSQAADGSFSCTTDHGKALTGKISGITNNLGIVTGNKLTFTIRKSSTVTETYSGSIKSVGSYGQIFAAGSFDITQKITSRLGITTLVNSGPFPFKMNFFSIGG